MTDTNTNGANGPQPEPPTTWRQITGWIKLADGSAIHVKTTTADRIGYSFHAQRYGWPKLGAADLDYELWQTFLLWHAAHRTGQYVGTWDDFVGKDCEVCQPDAQGEEVDPTPATQPSGY